MVKNDENKVYDGGKVASYIPPLARVDPNLFAVSFCSVDGQIISYGDKDYKFSI